MRSSGPGASAARGERPAGRTRVILRSVAALVGASLAVLSWLSCTERNEPLVWEAATRPGLQESTEALQSDRLVTASASFAPGVLTGSASYFMVGRVQRQDPFPGCVQARAYLKWDVADLPAGEITKAQIDVILRDVASANPADPDSFVLRLYEVDGAWTEDSLGTEPFPAIGDSIPGGRGVAQVTGVSDTSDVPITDLFSGEGLAQLVRTWRDTPEMNVGLAIELAPDEQQEGFLRLISRQGTPTGVAVNLSTPVLNVTVRPEPGGTDTTISREVAADGYVVFANEECSGTEPLAPPDSLLLLSSGHVQRVLLEIDLEALIAGDPDHLEGIAVHQATLRLAVEPGTDWSLGAEESATIWAYETTTPWSEDSIPSPVTLGQALSYDAVSEADTVLVLDVRPVVQQWVEGGTSTLVLASSAETSQFRSLLLKSQRAGRGRPQLRMVFSRPVSSRLGGRRD